MTGPDVGDADGRDRHSTLELLRLLRRDRNGAAGALALGFFLWFPAVIDWYVKGQSKHGISAGLVFIVSMLPGLWFDVKYRRLRRELHRSEWRLCPNCGQSLAGLGDPGRCPECGRGFVLEQDRALWQRAGFRVGKIS